MVYLNRVIAVSIVLLLAATVASAQVVTVWHEAPVCLPDRCRSPKLVAKVTSPERVDNVLVYFRGEGEGAQYFTMMRPSRDNAEIYWGYLPVTDGEEITFVEYVVEATDWDGVRSRSEVYKVEVSENCDVEELNDEEKRITRNLVVGLTQSAQNPVPTGFRCAGIVASVTAGGDLVPNEECRRRRAENGDDSGCPVGWLKPTAMAAAAVTGGILISEDPDEPQVPISPARP